ncbi:MAG TPA: hypothetical protein VFE47_18940 [Tepidisphaeraceae bacterium]|jgi:hypothetical protein|nr:hypothetical protein [Tepidisphaeraceae bacterium]
MIVIGVWVLTGCIYLPILEHTVSTQRDFRDLIGSNSYPAKIHPGVSRADVIALLGDTPYVSPDRRTAAYFVDAEEGFYVGVTCFGPEQSCYVLVLRYDPDGKVIEVKPGLEGGAGSLLQSRYVPFSELHEDYLRFHVPEIPVPAL